MPNGMVVKYCAAKLFPDQKYEFAALASIVPDVTASNPSKAGTSSPAAKCWIFNRPPDIVSIFAMRSVGLPGPTT